MADGAGEGDDIVFIKPRREGSGRTYVVEIKGQATGSTAAHPAISCGMLLLLAIHGDEVLYCQPEHIVGIKTNARNVVHCPKAINIALAHRRRGHGIAAWFLREP